MNTFIPNRNEQAALEYIKRKYRISKIPGSTDKQGRWYPAESEDFGLDDIRRPSARFPYSYWNACCSLKHVAQLFGADEKETRKIAKSIDATIKQNQVLDVRRFFEKGEADATIEMMRMLADASNAPRKPKVM